MDAETFRGLNGQTLAEALGNNAQPRVEESEKSLEGIPVGSKKLLRLLYSKKVEGTVEVASGGPATEIAIETLGQSQFAFYTWDVVCLDDAVVDVYISAGTVGGALGAGVVASLVKRRNFLSPDKVDVILLLDSVVSGTTTLAYRVYRIAGLE